MAVFKETWTISGYNDRWTEVLYRLAANLTGAQPVPLSVVTARKNMLAQGYVIEKVRISDVLNARQTIVLDQNAAGTQPVSSGNLESGESAMVYQLGCDPPNAAKRLVHIRGIISPNVTRDGNLPRGQESTEWKKLYRAWLTALVNQSYLIYNRFTWQEIGQRPQRVTIVDGSITAGLSTVTLNAPLTFQPSDRIRFTQMPKKDLPNMNGSFLVESVTGSTVVIRYVTPGAQKIEPTRGLAHVERFHTDSLISINVSRFLFYGSRQTKNAATGSRGSQFAHRNRLLP